MSTNWLWGKRRPRNLETLEEAQTKETPRPNLPNALLGGEAPVRSGSWPSSHALNIHEAIYIEADREGIGVVTIHPSGAKTTAFLPK